MPSVVYTLVFGVVAIVAFGVFLAFAKTTPLVIAGGMVAVYTAETLTGPIQVVGIGRTTIYATDILSLVGLVFALTWLVATDAPRPPPRYGAALTFLLLIVLAMGRGVFQGQLQQVGLEARPYLYLICGVLFFLSVPMSEREQRWLFDLCATAALVLVVIAASRWVSQGIGSSAGRLLDDGTYVDSRALDSGRALFLAQVGILAIGRRTIFGLFRRAWWLGPLLLITVLLLQTRTVWVATGAAVCFIVVTSGRRTRVATVGTGIVCAAALLVALTVVTSGSRDLAVASLSQSAGGLTSNSGTFAARKENWGVLIKKQEGGGPTTFALGQPFGAGFDRRVHGVTIRYQPHNFYLQTFLRLGVPGLAILLWLVGAALRKTDAGSDDEDMASRSGLLRAANFATAVYFVTYGAPELAAIWMGLTLRQLARGTDTGAGVSAPETLAGSHPSSP